ncbi:MAG: site-2 protease family protein [Chloroflexi bacterium]|nr:site-2 protease family protein [Chloroflexota bacterium]
MIGAITIARVRGIPVKLDFSWVIIFVLVTSTVSSEIGSQIKDLNPAALLLLAVLGSLIFFFSLLLHEMSHAFVAQNDKIGVRSVTLFLFGGVAQLENEPESPGAEFRMAAVGPAVSIVLGVIFLGIWYYAVQMNLWLPIIILSNMLGVINIALGIFNLVPAFPLDGGRIFRAIVWAITKDLRKATSIAVGMGKFFAFVLVLWGLMLLLKQEWISGIWLIFIALFLYQAASSSLRMVTIQKALSGVRVADIMSSPPVTVSPDLTVAGLVYEYFLSHRIFAYPVVENWLPTGIVTTEDVKKIPRERWDAVTVRDIMQPVTPDMMVSSEDDMGDAFLKLNESDKTRLLVMYQGKLVGILSTSDVSRFVQIRDSLDRTGRGSGWAGGSGNFPARHVRQVPYEQKDQHPL